MDIPLDVEVVCTDGVGGHSAAVVLNPVTKSISHVVVKAKGHAHEEYLVPLGMIGDSSVREILLRCSRDELGKLAPFMQTVRTEATGMGMMNAEALAGAEFQSGVGFEDFSMGGSGRSDYVEVEAIPDAELAVRVDTQVHGTDGHVGQADRFFAHADSGEIMQIVVREKHLLSKKDYIVPVDLIDRIGEDAIHLKLSKHEVEQLPRV